MGPGGPGPGGPGWGPGPGGPGWGPGPGFFPGPGGFFNGLCNAIGAW